MVELDVVSQVADGVLDIGVAAMTSVQIQGVPFLVGDESAISVTGKQRQLGVGPWVLPGGE